MAETIAANLNDGNSVKLISLGTWTCRLRPETQRMNGFTKQMCVVPAKVQVKHRPSRAFKEAATAKATKELQKLKGDKPEPSLKG